MANDPVHAAVRTHGAALQQLISRVNDLTQRIGQLQSRPTTVQEEIDAQPGRRIESVLSGEVTFTAADVGQRANPIVIQVSQDGPFVMTHYPMVVWYATAPTNTTNFNRWRPVNSAYLPTQQVTTDFIDLKYELNDGGFAAPDAERAPRATVLAPGQHRAGSAAHVVVAERRDHLPAHVPLPDVELGHPADRRHPPRRPHRLPHREPLMSYLDPKRALHGCFDSMGDDASIGSPYAQLAAQVNRFGPSAPTGLQFVSTPFPATAATLDPALAMAAVLICQRRATDAFTQFHDAGSAAAIAAANLGLLDPVTYVNARLADTTSTVASYADSMGLPAASSTISIPGIGDVSTTTLLMVGAAAVLGYMVLKPRRRS